MTPADALDPVGRTVDETLDSLRYDLSGDQMRSMVECDEAKLRAVLRRLEEAEKDVKRIDWLHDRIAQSSISVCQSLGLDHRIVGLRDALDAAAPRPDAGGAG